MHTLLYSQTKNFFLLSDVLVKLVSLHDDFRSQLASLPEPSEQRATNYPLTFEEELVVLRRKIMGVVIEKLTALLSFMRDYDADSCYFYCALALDPRFKSLSKFVRFAGGTDELIAVSEAYDSRFLIPMLARCKGIYPRSPEEAQDPLDDENSGIFGDLEEKDGPLDKIRWELRQFRRETYPHGKSTSPTDTKNALHWLLIAAQKYPTISRLARLFLSIVPTQVDNERAFSVAGVVCSLRRSTLNIETLSRLVHISLNTRDEGIFEDFCATDADNCEELEDFGENDSDEEEK